MFVVENRNRQYCMIFGFNFYEQKAQFDAGIHEIMIMDFGPELPGHPLPNYLKLYPDKSYEECFGQKWR